MQDMMCRNVHVALCTNQCKSQLIPLQKKSIKELCNRPLVAHISEGAPTKLQFI